MHLISTYVQINSVCVHHNKTARWYLYMLLIYYTWPVLGNHGYQVAIVMYV